MRMFLLAALAVPALVLTGVASAAPERPGNAPERFLVGFAGTPGGAERTAVARHGGAVAADLWFVDALAVTITPGGAGALAREASVRYVEPDHWREPLGLKEAELTPALSNGLYGLVTTRSTNAHGGGYTGSGIKACVADTGLDAGHPDIAANFVAGADFTGDGKGLRGEVDETHGTHVAGTVLAVRGNGHGVYGVAYGAKLHHARVLQNSGGFSSWIMNGVRWLVESQGCEIVNMSLGGRFGSKTEERFYNEMRAKGALVVAASGNDGARSISFPAGYAVNLAVGAVDVTSSLASFSNTGRNLDLVAPGVGVLSTVPRGLGYESSATVAGTDSSAFSLEYAGTTDEAGISGPVVDCGRATSPGECVNRPASGDWVALVERGDVTFATKVTNVTAAGAKAAILYNNVAGGFNGTLGEPGDWIPAVSVSRADGLAMLAALPATGQVVNLASDWDFSDGTSMATPHVSGAAALVWAAAAAAGKGPTPASVEDALVKTAQDLGARGYDTTFGHGLVQADAAIAHALNPPSGGGGGGGKGGGRK